LARDGGSADLSERLAAALILPAFLLSDPFSATAFAAPLDMTCPSCSSAMVRRVAKRGNNAGKPFWGCTRYPAGCRGTRPWDEQAADG